MPRNDDLQWLSEGLEDHQVTRSSRSSSSMMHKLTSPLRRLSNTAKRSSRSGSTDGGGVKAGAAAAMSKTSGNPFAGAELGSLASLPESARSFTEGMSAAGGRRQQLQMPRAQSQTLPQQGQTTGRLAGSGAASSSQLPRISAAGEGSRRRSSATGSARLSSGGVAEDDMAPYKRTFTKTSMQGMMARITGGGGGSRLSATGDAPPAAPQRATAAAAPVSQSAAASSPRVATPKAHVGEALRAQRAPPPPQTPAQKDAARLQALQDATKPKPKTAAGGTDPLTGGLFAEVPLEAMPAPKHSASPQSGTSTPARAGQQNPFSEYNAAMGAKSTRSARDGPLGAAAQTPTASGLPASTTPAAKAAAPVGGKAGGKADGKPAGGIAPLQVSASAAGAGSTASRWQPQEPSSPAGSTRGQGESRGWLSRLFPRRWQRLHDEVPSQHPGLMGAPGGTAQAAQSSSGAASTDYRTKSAAYIAYLQDLKHQIGGKLVSLTPFDIESGPADSSSLTKRRCGGAGRKCGVTSCILISMLVIAILTLLTMWLHRQGGRPVLPPPRLRPPPAG